MQLVPQSVASDSNGNDAAGCLTLRVHFCIRKRFALAATIAAIGVAYGIQPVVAQRLTPLSSPPDWERLDAFQNTITREDFLRLLDGVYAPGGAWKPFIMVDTESARIATRLSPPAGFTLRFAEGSAMPGRWWRVAAEMEPARGAGRELEGVHIAIDPGHIGGRYARVEERWFQIGRGKPVLEGEMTLLVARLMEARLKGLGARVTLLRRSNAPVTRLRAGELMNAARRSLADRGIPISGERYLSPNDPGRGSTVQYEAERLFYRVSEIRRRAEKVNTQARPDIVVCLHFNAEAWGDPENPDLVEGSHLHMLVNGTYSRRELSYDDARFEMLLKLLGRSHAEELAASKRVGDALAEASGLPPYVYRGANATRLSRFVWSRNLLANRLFECPVVYCEPYVMNSRGDYARIQAGDYDGVRNFGGRPRKSIFREYADAVVDGLRTHYAAERR